MRVSDYFFYLSDVGISVDIRMDRYFSFRILSFLR